MKTTVPWVCLMLVGGCAGTTASGGGTASHESVASGGEHGDHDDDDHDDDHAVANVTPEQAAHVLILQNETTDRATEALGTVDVHTSPGEVEAVALNRLRARAASVGADAVLGVEFHHGASGPTHLSGMAVRFHDLLEGRSYDVIGHLTVHSPMGHDHQALDHLREQARAQHADLILNIQFHHGDDPHGPTELTGDAIRYRNSATR